MHSPTDAYWSIVKRLLQYLKGTLNHGFLLHHVASPTIHAFSNVDWVTILMIVPLLPLMLFFLVLTPFHRAPRSKNQSLVHLPKLNIGQWLPQVLRYVRLCLCCVNFMSLYLLHQPSIVNIGATYLCSNPVF